MFCTKTSKLMPLMLDGLAAWKDLTLTAGCVFPHVGPAVAKILHAWPACVYSDTAELRMPGPVIKLPAVPLTVVTVWSLCHVDNLSSLSRLAASTSTPQAANTESRGPTAGFTNSVQAACILCIVCIVCSTQQKRLQVHTLSNSAQFHFSKLNTPYHASRECTHPAYNSISGQNQSFIHRDGTICLYKVLCTAAVHHTHGDCMHCLTSGQ